MRYRKVPAFLRVAAIDGLGFVFSDYKHAWQAMDGELRAYVRGEIGKTGLYVFAKTVEQRQQSDHDEHEADREAG